MFNEDFLLLISLLVLNWPIIKAMGFGLPAPILIIVSDVISKERTLECMSFNKVRCLSLQDKSDPCNVLESVSSEAVFVDVSEADHLRSNKLLERLELIMSAVSGKISGKVIDCLPVLISVGRLPENLKERVLTVPLEFRSITKPDLDCLIPATNDFGLIRRHTLEDCNTVEAEPALLAAAYCMYPEAERRDDKLALERLKEVAVNITKYNRCLSNPEGVAELFKAEFYTWLNSEKDVSGYWLPNITEEAEARIESAFFFQKGFVYVHKCLFETISGNLLDSVGINALKSALEMTEILVTEKNAKSSRMYYNVSNKDRDIRMLKLRLEALEMVGQVSLVDLCFCKED